MDAHLDSFTNLGAFVPLQFPGFPLADLTGRCLRLNLRACACARVQGERSIFLAGLLIYHIVIGLLYLLLIKAAMRMLR